MTLEEEKAELRRRMGALRAGVPAGEVAAFAVCGAFVVLRHRSNIERLRRGEERSLVAGGEDDAG